MSRRRLRLLRTPRTFLTVLLLLLASQSSQTQVGNPPGLNFFKNFFVTGNHVAASVDFGSQSGGGGFVTGVINFDDPSELVPADADVVGAFLYWQTIASGSLPTTGLTFRGQDITDIAKEVRSVALDPNFSPCWSGGGQGTLSMKTFRADVRRFLPVVTNENGVPLGRTLVNDADLVANDFPLHEVTLPDNGTGNQTPQTAGASLIVIYRLPSEPLTSIVLYDGLQLKTNAMPTTSQTLRGFYQASANPFAKLTLLVGSGAKNATEQVRFGRGLATDSIIATNPFFTRETNSPGSDRAWESPTWDVSNEMPNSPVTTQYGEEVTVQVTHPTASPYDCLATSAIVFSTDVEDADFDGLLNVWETGDATHTPLLEPTGQALPNLHAMGADPNVQDIFIEVGFMSSGGYDDPLPGLVPLHTHLPSQKVLDDVADVFAKAANRKNPADLTAPAESGQIKVHFDVGNRYPASPNVIKYKHANGTTTCAAITDPACLARGGEEITEIQLCSATETTCDFPGFRGVVGWKGGFWMLKNQALLNLNNNSIPTEAQCVTLGPAACVRRFDENRRHIFRYALFAHALGVARDQPDDPTTPFHEDRFPRSVSGVADGGNGGGDVMITLGLWDNFTGTEHMQKTVLVHEFGHTGGLRHGGSAPRQDNPAPNCMPNYQSVMNYLYQVRGIIGQSKSQTGPTIVPVIDYSRQVLQLVTPGSPQLEDLDESSLTETALKQGNASALHPPRWYAPKAGSFLDNLAGTTASTRHCDGSPLNATNNPADAIDMVRVDATDPAAAIDWDASGTITSSGYPQDINFNGDGVNTSLDPAADGVFKGWNDWEHLDLRQTGSRRNPGVLTLEVSLDELSANDPAWNDPAWNDPTWNDPAWNDPAWNDPTWNDPAWNDPAWNQEIDETQARSLGPAPNSLSFTTTNKSIDLKWNNPPAGGSVQAYHVLRALGVISLSNQPTDITPGGVSPTAICNATTGARFCDTSAQNNRNYQYVVVAWFANGDKARSEIITARR